MANTLLGALSGRASSATGSTCLNVSPNVQLVVIGAIIVAAVFFDKLKDSTRA